MSQDTLVAASAQVLAAQVWVPIILSAVAVLVALTALWRSHLRRFKPEYLAGDLTLRIYPIRSEDERWYIPSLETPLTVANDSARPGIVRGLRIVARYGGVKIPDHYEVFEPRFEIDPSRLRLIDKNRFNWIDKAVASHWTRFLVLPQAIVSKRLIFETRWDEPVIDDEVSFTLEVMDSRSGSWRAIEEWRLSLGVPHWLELVRRGTSFTTSPRSAIPMPYRLMNPPDLHAHTRPEEPLPEEGPNVPPSFLDFPESE